MKNFLMVVEGDVVGVEAEAGDMASVAGHQIWIWMLLLRRKWGLGMWRRFTWQYLHFGCWVSQKRSWCCLMILSRFGRMIIEYWMLLNVERWFFLVILLFRFASCCCFKKCCMRLRVGQSLYWVVTYNTNLFVVLSLAYLHNIRPTSIWSRAGIVLPLCSNCPVLYALFVPTRFYIRSGEWKNGYIQCFLQGPYLVCECSATLSHSIDNSMHSPPTPVSKGQLLRNTAFTDSVISAPEQPHGYGQYYPLHSMRHNSPEDVQICLHTCRSGRHLSSKEKVWLWSPTGVIMILLTAFRTLGSPCSDFWFSSR